MSGSSLGFEAELRISPKSVVAMLMIFGVVLSFAGDGLADPASRVKLGLLAILFWTASATAWLIDSWKTSVGRWFTITVLVTIVYLGNDWMGVPGFLSLMVIPTALAAALISFPAAAVTAIGQTALLLLPKPAAVDANPTATTITSIAIWMTLGVIFAMYRSQRLSAQQSWDRFQEARTVLKESRDRKAELKQALDDLAHANRQLALTNERLAGLRLIAEEAEKTKTAFLAKVSHEFRTPLNMIIGLVDLLVETPEIYGEYLPPKLLEHLEIVTRNCKHLSDLVDDVLDLSQIDAGRMVLHREWVDLKEIIRGALALVNPLAEQKKIDLLATIPDDLPECYCDRVRITQVMVNLLSNAARFTERGKIGVQVALEDRHVVVSVSDTGPGIPPQDAERIFEPFNRGTSRLWQDKGGSGLGLSISKQFVELHDGRMWLESEVGVGSTFSFRLAISPSTVSTAGLERWIMEDWDWVRRTSRADTPPDRLEQRVILCDETGEIHRSFSRYSDGIEYADTQNLDQAVCELRQCPAQAVVLNAASPSDLWSLVERAREKMPDTPIIGCCVPARTERASAAGATDYLIKPITRARLQEAIRTLARPVRRVLVVDDEADARQLLTALLQAGEGTLEVTTASSGQQALNMLRSQSPDLMLLDILMPEVDGWQVLSMKSQDEAIADIPVILISAQDPSAQPTLSQAVVATMGEGLSLSKLLRCSQQLSTLLMQPD